MARRFLVLVLFLGAILGFGSALRFGFRHRREAYERHLADVCAEAALRATSKTSVHGP